MTAPPRQVTLNGLAVIDAVQFDVDPMPDHIGKGPEDLRY